ncbi:MAG: ABC transporter substrate-binding protein [Pseudomonadota bacterium]
MRQIPRAPRPTVRLAALLAAVLLPGLLAATPAAADADAARATAERLVEDAHGALADDGRAEAQRIAALRAAVDEAFAFDVWERFLLGSSADRLSAAERAEFRALLPGFLADLYRKQFGKGLQAKPEIREVRPARRDFLVRAAIPRANGKTLPVDWRVRDFAERGHLVIDVMVGGTSFLILKRDEFSALLKSGGPDALLEHMRANSV